MIRKAKFFYPIFLIVLIFSFLGVLLSGCGGTIQQITTQPTLTDGVPKVQNALTGENTTTTNSIKTKKPFTGLLQTISQVTMNYNGISRSNDSLILMGLNEIQTIEQGLKPSTETFLTELNNPDFDYYYKFEDPVKLSTILFNSSLDKWLIISTKRDDGEIRIHLYEVKDGVEMSTIIFYRVDIDDMIDLTQVIEDTVNNRKVVKCERVYDYSKPESERTYIDLSSICRLDDDIHKTTFSISLIGRTDLGDPIEIYQYGVSNDVDLLVAEYTFDTPQSSITLDSSLTEYIGFDEVIPLHNEFYTLDDLKDIYLDIDKTNHTYMNLKLGDTMISFDLNKESAQE